MDNEARCLYIDNEDKLSNYFNINQLVMQTKYCFKIKEQTKTFVLQILQIGFRY